MPERNAEHTHNLISMNWRGGDDRFLVVTDGVPANDRRAMSGRRSPRNTCRASNELTPESSRASGLRSCWCGDGGGGDNGGVGGGCALKRSRGANNQMLRSRDEIEQALLVSCAANGV